MAPPWARQPGWPGLARAAAAAAVLWCPLLGPWRAAPPAWARPGAARSPRALVPRSAGAAAGSGGGGGTDAPGSAGKSVLFVCLGNICRSPSAEAVARALAARRGLEVRVDSCGTGGGSASWYKPNGFSYHEGDPADPRMTRVAARRGVQLTSLSRPLRAQDFDAFDKIVGMDRANDLAIKQAATFWGVDRAKVAAKVDSMTTYLQGTPYSSNGVPDPYYGEGDAGFELVLDLLEGACGKLLDELVDGK